MYFYFADEVTNFLFEGWTTITTAGFLGTCLAVVAVTLFLEGIRFLRLHFKQEAAADPLRPPAGEDEAGSRSPLVRDLLIPPSVAHIRRKKRYLHVYQTGLRVIQLVFGYLIMLAVMTYNAWFLLSVALASGLGYYFTGLYTPAPVGGSTGHRTTNNINTSDTSEPVSQNSRCESRDIPSNEHTPSDGSELNVVADLHV